MPKPFQCRKIALIRLNELAKTFQHHRANNTLRRLLVALGEGDADCLLADTRIIPYIFLHELQILHETVEVFVKEGQHQQILHGHHVFRFV